MIAEMTRSLIRRRRVDIISNTNDSVVVFFSISKLKYTNYNEEAK